jgi:hypothetical protein
MMDSSTQLILLSVGQGVTTCLAHSHTKCELCQNAINIETLTNLITCADGPYRKHFLTVLS